ncbi:DUF1249 domain-containing protein [Dehalobacter sp. TeCB1]|uniref:DUF1249 domain-containing protein n=1 Tax=Dehalobacter sp. TeCB1 TaxID=1843715 RepID=UPI00083B1816|nr:DUF1249 domain-containing protein [Dehalobacter sp. TeCB1]OCZ50855.1 hypothetical protein A7D23_14250 [Dehalobacter sp. TeCB1]
MKTIYELNYERIYPLLADYKKLSIKNFMDLVVQKIGKNEYQIAHYYEQNGDLMADPEMTVRIDPELKTVEALTFQMDAIGLYQEVYPEPGQYYPRLKKELNDFLRQWLKNLEQQGFIKEALNK